MSTNVEFALDNLKYRKDGKFDFEEFKGMHHLYPSVLFPAFRLQNAMMQVLTRRVNELELGVVAAMASTRCRIVVTPSTWPRANLRAS